MTITNTSKENKIFLIIFIFFILINLVELSWLRMLPFIDLSFHLAAATIYRYIGQAGNQFSNYYEVDAFLKPNTFHMWFCSIPIFTTVEAGNKVFYLLYAGLLPVSILLIINYIKGNTWVSLISFAFLYNTCTIFGNTGYTLGIPTFIITFYFFIKGIEKNNNIYKSLTAALLVLLYFEHALITLFAVFVLSLCLINIYKNSLIDLIKNFSILIPVFFLIIIWRTGSESASHNTTGFLINYYKTEYLSTLPKRINFLYMDYLFLFKEKLYGRALGVTFNLIIYFSLAILIFKDTKRFKGSLKNNNIACLWIFFISAMICHIVLPNQIPDQIMILYERFPTMVTLAGIILLSWYMKDTLTFYFKYLSILIASTSTFLWTWFFIEFEHQNKYFTKDIFPDETKNVRLVGLITNYYFRNVECYIMYPDFFITWKKGIQSTSAIDYGLGAVRRKASKKILPVYDHWMVKKGQYNHEYDGIEYVLCNGDLPLAFADFIKHYRMEKTSGPWKLFHKVN